jgi:hypothetical protein
MGFRLFSALLGHFYSAQFAIFLHFALFIMDLLPCSDFLLSLRCSAPGLLLLYYCTRATFFLGTPHLLFVKLLNISNLMTICAAIKTDPKAPHVVNRFPAKCRVRSEWVPDNMLFSCLLSRIEDQKYLQFLTRYDGVTSVKSCSRSLHVPSHHRL